MTTDRGLDVCPRAARGIADPAGMAAQPVAADATTAL